MHFCCVNLVLCNLVYTGICTLHGQRRWARTCSDIRASTNHWARACLSHQLMPMIGLGRLVTEARIDFGYCRCRRALSPTCNIRTISYWACEGIISGVSTWYLKSATMHCTVVLSGTDLLKSHHHHHHAYLFLSWTLNKNNIMNINNEFNW